MKCLSCGLENHASVEEYEQIFCEVMLEQPQKLWSKEELFEKVNTIAVTRKHKELGIK